jgi:hypothetical protein
MVLRRRSALALFSMFSLIYYPTFLYLVVKRHEKGKEWDINRKEILVLSFSLIFAVLFLSFQVERIQIFVFSFSIIILIMFLIGDIIKRIVER